MSTRRSKDQLTKEEALMIFTSGSAAQLSARDRALFQFSQDLLCMPWEVFHDALTESLGRDVYTSEFAYPDALYNELLGEKEPPSFRDVVAQMYVLMGLSEDN